jgi:hypothetical protein
MAIHHTFFGPADLPVPEPLRRQDRPAASAAGVRVVRPGRAGDNTRSGS